MTCVSDLSIVPKQVNGERRVVERLARRLSTPRKTLLDGATRTGQVISNANYGMDIGSMIQETLSRKDLSDLRAQIQAEVLKDPDVDTAKIGLTYSIKTKELVIAIQGYGPKGSIDATFVALSNGIVVQ